MEHLSYNDFRKALQNTFRILAARRDIPAYCAGSPGTSSPNNVEEVSKGSPEASANFMRACDLGLEQRPKSVLGRARLLFGSSHLWMWDEPSIIEQLKLAGFTDIRRCEFGDFNDPMFGQVEDCGRFIAGTLRELAIAARKPDAPGNNAWSIPIAAISPNGSVPPRGSSGTPTHPALSFGLLRG